MTIDKKITFEMFDKYRKDYCGGSEDKFVLYKDWYDHPWEENKQTLQKLFHNELIISKNITIEQPYADMRAKLNGLIVRYRDFYLCLCQKLCSALNINYDDAFTWLEKTFEQGPDGEYHGEVYDIVVKRGFVHMIDYAFNDAKCLYNNTVPMDVYNMYVHYAESKYEHKITVDINGTKITIQDSQKLMKALAQIAKALDMSEEFENFRISQSQITNLRNIHGTLCLSIHPLDFATASDNENGWHSCMSWQNEGCYRLGTTEMMNSPIVACAYVSSDTTYMVINDEEWDSKKWRAWVIITPEYIFVNRQYPYHDDKIAIEVLNWVRELAKESFGWEYEEPNTNFVKLWEDRAAAEDWDSHIRIKTNYMYNDVGGDDIVGCMSTLPQYYPKDNPNYEYVNNISGPAQCMCCGAIIPPGYRTESTLLCDECDEPNIIGYCEYCGEPIYEDSEDVYTWESGAMWCRSCMDEHAIWCESCETYRDNTDSGNVAVFDIDRRYSNYVTLKTMCADCIRTLDSVLVPADGHNEIPDWVPEDLHDKYKIFLEELRYMNVDYVLCPNESFTADQLNCIICRVSWPARALYNEILEKRK